MIDSCQSWWLLTHVLRCLASPYLSLLVLWRSGGRNCVFFWLLTRCVLFLCSLSLSLIFFYAHKSTSHQQSTWPMSQLWAACNKQWRWCRTISEAKFYHVLPVVAKRKGMKDSNVAVPLRQGLQAAGECQGPQTKIETPKALKNLGQLLSTTLPTLQYTLILLQRNIMHCPIVLVCMLKMDETCSYNFWFWLAKDTSLIRGDGSWLLKSNDNLEHKGVIVRFSDYVLQNLLSKNCIENFESPQEGFLIHVLAMFFTRWVCLPAWRMCEQIEG